MFGHATTPQSRAARPQATACRPCAKAKVKCVYGDQGAPCERRFAQLEHKVESLMKELEIKNQPHLSDTSRAGHIPSSQEPSPGSSSGDYARSVDMPQNIGSLLEREASQPSSRLQARPVAASDDDLVELFHIYREELAPFFPFVVIPDVPPAQLYAEKPFLFKAMAMAAAYKTRAFQHQLGTRLTEEVGRRLLVDGERSLDLLQGLLIHIAWYHCHLGRVSQMTNLIQLAIALLADLGFNKPTYGSDRRKLEFDRSSTMASTGVLAESRILTNDEKRALLGCFYISSVFVPCLSKLMTMLIASSICAIFRRVHALEYTPYMEKQLQALLDTREYESDMLLARMTQVQEFAERVVQAVPYDDPDKTQFVSAPVVLHLKTLRKEFRLQTQLFPPEIENNVLLLLQKYAVEVLIHENGLYSSLWNPPATVNERIDVLWTLLQSIKAFFHVFIDVPDPMMLFQVPYSSWGQAIYVMLTFSRLASLECPGWDPQVARDTYDFATPIDAIIKQLEMRQEFASAHWLGEQPDLVISRIKDKVQFIKTWWQSYQARSNADQSRSQEIPPPTMDFGPGAVLGDDFWDELMKDCEPLQF
ncbi:uncharacterized protein N7459_006957 [Penicillium hispanicum]|uniref:uncharacterized protein n=1 Tax=Penicillium hispanicum TaxID=1080232 RepID=UPI00253F901B|nr:uncharacterized protein N7459_006957 [Penicillium hispanicum]KAJ5577993.1 hypothetical protein N7459_006957 [Penicillium hispanicum]